MSGLENVDQVMALSPIQEGMLYHTISAPGQGVFVTQIALDLDGPLEPEQLRSAWDELVDKHAALRTSFLWDGLDEPVQVVHRSIELDWRLIDPPADFDQWLKEDRLAAFQMSAAPLMRHFLMRRPGGWRLVWTFHHILLDGWSANIVLRDMLSVIAGRKIGGPSQYDCFLEAVHASDGLAFWKDRLGSRDAATVLADPFAPAGQGHAHLRKSLSRTRTDEIRAFARAQRITPNTLVLGAWARCLASVGDDAEPLFGTTVTTRPDSIEGIEEAVGVFINTLPFSVPVDATPVGAFLQALQRDQQSCQLHGLTALPDIKQASALPQGTPFFDSIVVFENHAAAVEDFETILEGTGLKARIAAFIDQSNYPLALLAIPGPQLAFELVFDRQKFSEEFALGLLNALEHVLMGFVSAPGVAVCQIPIAEADRTGAIADTNHAPLPAVVSAHPPANPALVDEQGGRISYEQLDRQAAELAGALIASGAAPGELIGLYARRGAEYVTGMLAILKAGMAFAPLDPDYPQAYLSAAAENAGLGMAIASADLTEQARALVGKVLSCQAKGPQTARDIAPGDLAYVIQTSGSQGRPKGVAVSHANIAYSTAVRRQVYGGGPSRFLLLSPVGFDSAMVGLFWTLSEGGTLVLPAPGQEKDIAAIAALIKGERISHLLCIPSLWQMILEFSDADMLGSLDTVIVAGEACPEELPRRHADVLPKVRLFNEYGPTEASVWCIAGEIGANLGPVPIGAPIPGTTAYLMDRWGQPVPEGMPGELYISGPGVAQGYLNLPDATRQRFLDDPHRPGVRMYRTGDLACRRKDGAYVYLGRVDEQIKINGYRIEPGEIAACLTGHPGIRAAEVMLVAADDPAQLAARLAALSAEDAEDLMSKAVP